MRNSKRPTTAGAKKPRAEPRRGGDSATTALDATSVLSDEFDLTANSVDARSRFAVLRDKYLELARKYTGVVKLLERNAAQQADVFRLGLWAPDGTAKNPAGGRRGQ